MSGDGIDGACVQLVRILPRPDMGTEMAERRGPFVAAFRAAFPELLGARLIETEAGEPWLDLWFWSSRAAAERALETAMEYEAFRRWSECVDVVSFDYGSVTSDL